MAADGVSPIHGTAPHVPHAVRVHLRPRVMLPDERVVGWDLVRCPVIVSVAAAAVYVNVNAQHFTQKSTPCKRKRENWCFSSNILLTLDRIVVIFWIAFLYFVIKMMILLKLCMMHFKLLKHSPCYKLALLPEW